MILIQAHFPLEKAHILSIKEFVSSNGHPSDNLSTALPIDINWLLLLGVLLHKLLLHLKELLILLRTDLLI
jgi:hypothetical protein